MRNDVTRSALFQGRILETEDRNNACELYLLGLILITSSLKGNKTINSHFLPEEWPPSPGDWRRPWCTAARARTRWSPPPGRGTGGRCCCQWRPPSPRGKLRSLCSEGKNLSIRNRKMKHLLPVFKFSATVSLFSNEASWLHPQHQYPYLNFSWTVITANVQENMIELIKAFIKLWRAGDVAGTSFPVN